MAGKLMQKLLHDRSSEESDTEEILRQDSESRRDSKIPGLIPRFLS